MILLSFSRFPMVFGSKVELLDLYHEQNYRQGHRILVMTFTFDKSEWLFLLKNAEFSQSY